MTISSVDTRRTYSGNGTTDAFATPYFVLDADLKVYVDGVLQTLSTHYTLTGAGSVSGGTCTFVTPPPTGTASVIIIRDPELTQGLDLVENDLNPAEAREQAFDKLTMIAQRSRDLIDRALVLPDAESSSGLDMTLPDINTRSSKFLAFDANGEPLASVGSGTPASTFMATVLDDADAFEATGTLKAGYIVANKAEAAALTLTSADAGRRIIATSTDGGMFTVEYNPTPGTYADDGDSYFGKITIPTGGDGTIGIVREPGPYINVLAYGATIGASDSTTAIINAAATISDRGLVLIPSGVTYNHETLLASSSVPVGAVFLDLSIINGANTSGNKDGSIGIFDKGDPTAVNDTSWVVSSGHNANLVLDNTGKSGSASSLKRIVAMTWAAGRFAKGSLVKLLRTVARLEFSKSSSESGRWAMVLRSRAPWDAVDADYFRWASGVTVSAIGEYCFSNNKYYVSASTGTTGSTAPSHTTGTVSDGGVDWTYVPFNYDATTLYVDDIGRISTNGARGTSTWRFKQSTLDSENAVATVEATGTSKTAVFALVATDGADAASTAPYLKNAGDNKLTVVKSDGSAGVVAVSDSGIELRSTIKPSSTAADLDTTPTVLGIGTLIITNSVATNVTTFDDGVTNQEIELLFGNGNTTLVNGATLRLAGSVNVTPTTLSTITIRKSSLTGAWHEVSRAII